MEKFATEICMLLVLVCSYASAGQRLILAINEDNDRYLYCAKDDALTVKGAQDYFDTVAAGGAVTHFFMCVNGQRTSYGSKVWEPIWLGIGEGDEYGRTNNPWCVNAKILNDRGIDLWKIWCARAREKGVSPWISMRMNDAHNASAARKMHRNETFWWEHPELWRYPDSRGKKGESLQAFDYSKTKVRERALALAREILERWDADGLELDWMRQRKCLSPGKEREQAAILTGFMREVRSACNEAACRRGHPVKLAVRVPTTLPGTLHHGFDILEWAREGLVDVVVPSPEYWVADFDMDVPGWKRALKEVNPDVLLLPCTDIGIYGSSACRFEIHKDLALLRGWAANAQGGDGLYLFNAPYYGERQRSFVYGGELLPERIARSRRRFPVTFHEGLPPALSAKQLPCELVDGAELRIAATCGPYDSRARVVIAAEKPCVAVPDISLNGAKPLSSLRLAVEDVFPDVPKTPCEVFAWDFPASTACSGVNTVRVWRAHSQTKAIWCELVLDAVSCEKKKARTAQMDEYSLPPASAQVYAEAVEARTRLMGKIGKSAVFGHRGDSEEAPENTLPAFMAAARGGFGIEADVYATKDGVAVMCHDRYLHKGKYEVDGWVTNLLWKGCLDHVDAGAWKGERWKGTRFATLDEFLELATDSRMLLLDIKDSCPWARVKDAILEALARHPNANPSNLVLQTGGDYIRSRVPGYRDVRCARPRFGWKTTDRPRDLACDIDALDNTRIAVWNIRWDEELLTKKIIARAHARGIKVSVWTVNDAVSAWVAFGRGVDWVIADRPVALWREMHEGFRSLKSLNEHYKVNQTVKEHK